MLLTLNHCIRGRVNTKLEQSRVCHPVLNILSSQGLLLLERITLNALTLVALRDTKMGYCVMILGLRFLPCQVAWKRDATLIAGRAISSCAGTNWGIDIVFTTLWKAQHFVDLRSRRHHHKGVEGSIAA